jgi:hypothetical protein
MPFRSKRQARAAFAGVIPGMDKADARRWASETPDLKALPDRAPAEKGKPTMRSKKANGDMLQYFLDHPEKLKERNERKAKEEARKKMAGVLDGARRVGALAKARVREIGQKERSFHGGVGKLLGASGDPTKRTVGELEDRLVRRGRAATGSVFAAGGAAGYSAGRAHHHEKRAVADAFAPVVAELGRLLAKSAGLGSAASSPSAVGKFKGMMTTNALKTPGYAASVQATNPRKSVVSAMNVAKPRAGV